MIFLEKNINEKIIFIVRLNFHRISTVINLYTKQTL